MQDVKHKQLKEMSVHKCFGVQTKNISGEASLKNMP